VKVARLFFALPESTGFLLAGGAAMVAQHLTTRRTEDLDFFTTPETGHVPAAATLWRLHPGGGGWSTELAIGTDSVSVVSASPISTSTQQNLSNQIACGRPRRRAQDRRAHWTSRVIAYGAGLKVWPREVEDVLYGHPAVRQAAVVGVPDRYRGETVKAYVSLKPGTTVSEEELIRLCKQQMTAYKSPRSIGIVEDLPKTTTGKILRRELRESNP
jgi:AMP-binding enzyme